MVGVEPTGEFLPPLQRRMRYHYATSQGVLGAGFEPAFESSKLPILPLDDPKIFVISPGIEPGPAGPKTAVIPLHHETIFILYFPTNL